MKKLDGEGSKRSLLEFKVEDRMMKTIRYAVLMVICFSGIAFGEQVKLNVALEKPLLMAGRKQTTYLKVGLTGFELDDAADRAPVNVAIVLDKSGSMSGQKIEKAKEAAIMVLDLLDHSDIVSVIAYNNNVEVLVPATKMSNRRGIRSAIRGLRAGGSTALFAGVSKGAAEVRKFLRRNRVNRVILLSDGIANVGPSSPGELGSLGSALIEEGISVTTIGLGLNYNEDLLTRLAYKSDGNHAFAQSANDLAKIFKYEFGDVLSVAAQEVVVRINCARGIRPVRVLGREADIAGRTVTANINQLYSGQEKFVLLEVEIPAFAARSVCEVATVTVTYANMSTSTTDRLTSTVAARFTNSPALVESEIDKDVAVDALKLVANERSRLAVALRDKGQIEDARELLEYNVRELKKYGKKYDSPVLEKEAAVNIKDAKGLKEKEWNETRKKMRSSQHKTDMQQTW